MRRLGLILLFGLINFGGLALGSWLMGEGPGSEWYKLLDKAPWTPPGWVFGVAWTTIMICFSLYLAEFVIRLGWMPLRMVLPLLLIFNISWNYVFFNQHWVFLALLNLLLLTGLVWLVFFRFKKEMELRSYLLAPYMIWLIVACSLNAYAWLNN